MDIRNCQQQKIAKGTQVPLEQGKKNGMAFIYIAWLVNTFLSCTLDCQCNSYVT